MISVQKCRDVLGTAAAYLTDAEIDAMRRQLYAIADVAINVAGRARSQGTIPPSPNGKYLTCQEPTLN